MATMANGRVSPGREALEVELNMQPLEVRRMEQSVREAGRILSKDVDVPIKSSWENWRETENTERYMSPFCKMLIQLEDIKAETGIDTFNIEQDFSFREGLYPTLTKPEYWSRLGSSKNRTNDQKDFVLLLYVPCQQLWSLRDGQFT